MKNKYFLLLFLLLSPIKSLMVLSREIKIEEIINELEKIEYESPVEKLKKNLSKKGYLDILEKLDMLPILAELQLSLEYFCTLKEQEKAKISKIFQRSQSEDLLYVEEKRKENAILLKLCALPMNKGLMDTFTRLPSHRFEAIASVRIDFMDYKGYPQGYATAGTKQSITMLEKTPPSEQQALLQNLSKTVTDAIDQEIEKSLRHAATVLLS